MTDLEYSEQWLPEGVKVTPRFVLRVVKVELAAKQLHPKQGKDHDEKEKQQQ